MKKLLFTICAIAMFSSAAMAVCDEEHGGTPVAGGKFCVSNFPLNWWSAYMWCKGIGMEMASMYDVCPDWKGHSADTFPVIDSTITGWRWTSTPSGTDNAFAVNLSSGAIRNDNYFSRNNGNHYADNVAALCR